MDFSSTAVALSLAVTLAVVVITINARRLCDKKKRYHPIAGTVLHQLINFHRMHHYKTELASKYKTYRVLDLFKTAVYTAGPANVEYMLKTNFTNYGKGTYLYSILSDSLGDGIFAVDMAKSGGIKGRPRALSSQQKYSETSGLQQYSLQNQCC